jgi:hypothetical protein
MHTPTDLILALQAASGARTFVETGTYLGDTTEWASQHFASVHSVELSQTLHAGAVERFAGKSSVTLHHGRSENLLGKLTPASGQTAIFWLDAHWSGPGTDGEDAECPILAEIEAINRVSTHHIILIDDADYFFRPPPPPHNVSHWPLLPDVFDALRAGNCDAVIVILARVIVKVPAQLKDALSRILQSDTTLRSTART